MTPNNSYQITSYSKSTLSIDKPWSIREAIKGSNRQYTEFPEVANGCDSATGNKPLRLSGFIEEEEMEESNTYACPLSKS